MSMQLIEGFDFWGPSQASLRSWSGSPFATFQTGRTGAGKASRLDGGGGNQLVIKPLPSTFGTVVLGVAMNLISGSYCSAYLRTSGGTLVAEVRVTTSGVSILNGSGTTIASNGTAIATGVWHFYELKIFVNGASGTCELHVDGISLIASTVGNFGSTNIGQVGLFVTTFAVANFDDVYVLDSGGSANNTFLGDTTIETIFPTADGAHTQWTPDSGTAHYSRVNQTLPDDDSSYVSDSTISDRDSYAFTDLATLVGNVYAVQTNMYARKDAAGARQLCAATRPSSTDHDGATVTLSTSYAYFSELTEQNPDTSSAWTISGINGSEWGVKVVT